MRISRERTAGDRGSKCPICNRETQHEGDPFRPFCSERCKLIDLDNWLSGRYRVSGSQATEEGPGETVSEEFDEQGGRKETAEVVVPRRSETTRTRALDQSHDHV